MKEIIKCVGGEKEFENIKEVNVEKKDLHKNFDLLGNNNTFRRIALRLLLRIIRFYSTNEVI